MFHSVPLDRPIQVSKCPTQSFYVPSAPSNMITTFAYVYKHNPVNVLYRLSIDA
ncbi:hypothetical protein SIN01_12280 [Sporolactobacillus inulinus]|nr:hypothetical protein SIN01_12280 [Sporolactobacillus inulinus]